MSRDTKDKILESAKNRLLQTSVETFSMRNIARDCNISPGTIYNYFPDKNALIAAIMIEDWHKALSEMETGVNAAGSFSEGLEKIYNAITGFAGQYLKVWSGYQDTGNYVSIHGRRHRELIDEINRNTRKLLIRFADEDALTISRLLSESILTTSLHEEITLNELLAYGNYIVKEN